ncbi:MAG TPA: cytochrome c [Gemmatimonadaceae bacterium]
MTRAFILLPRFAFGAALVATLGAASTQVAARSGAVPTDTTAADVPGVTPQSVRSGRAIFHGQGGCVACHGLDLQGSAIAPPLNKQGKPWLAAKGGTYDEILRVIEKGVPATAMLARPNGISDQAARDVAAYVWAVNHGGAKP